MDKIIILGASMLQIPGIIKAKELGYYVIVLDANNQAEGKKYADEFYCISTTDTEKIKEIAIKKKPRVLFTLASDMPMKSISKISKQLGLPCINEETAEIVTNKGAMSEAFKKNNINAPWYHIIKSYDELQFLSSTIDYPCIMKPTDSAGSRGVILVDKKADLLSSYEYSLEQSKKREVIVQEYMEGKEISVEALVENHQVEVIAITDKFTTGPPNFVEMGHSQPTTLDSKTQDDIISLTRKMVQGLDINIGPLHVEMIITSEGPKIVEVGARLGGDNITSHLTPLSTGVDIVGETIKLLSGKGTTLNSKYKKASAIKYIFSTPGTIVEIKNVNQVLAKPGVKEVRILKKIGDSVKAVQNSTDRVGYIIAQSNNVKKAHQICKEAEEEIEIVTKVK